MLRRIAHPKVLAAIWRFYRRTEQAELDLISAGVAFFVFLAVFPAAAAVIAIWGIAFDPLIIRGQMELLRDMLPLDAANLVSTQVEGLLAVSGGGLGWATALSTLLALWSARAGVAAMMRGLNAIHQLPNRAGHRHQASAMALTLVLIALAMAAMMASLVLPLLARVLPGKAGDLIGNPVLIEAVGLGLVVLATALAYHYGPNFGQRPRPPLFSWGLAIAVVIWGLATRGFMLYLAHFPAYNQIYGSIGAVVALLMWLYVSAYAVLLGAAFDAEHARAKRQ